MKPSGIIFCHVRGAIPKNPFWGLSSAEIEAAATVASALTCVEILCLETFLLRDSLLCPEKLCKEYTIVRLETCQLQVSRRVIVCIQCGIEIHPLPGKCVFCEMNVMQVCLGSQLVSSQNLIEVTIGRCLPKVWAVTKNLSVRAPWHRWCAGVTLRKLLWVYWWFINLGFDQAEQMMHFTLLFHSHNCLWDLIQSGARATESR